jgi:hypothetical protein
MVVRWGGVLSRDSGKHIRIGEERPYAKEAKAWHADVDWFSIAVRLALTRRLFSEYVSHKSHRDGGYGRDHQKVQRSKSPRKPR